MRLRCTNADVTRGFAPAQVTYCHQVTSGKVVFRDLWVSQLQRRSSIDLNLFMYRLDIILQYRPGAFSLPN